MCSSSRAIPNRSRNTGRDTLAWVSEVQDRGAGEIVLNCMTNDGVRRGYDVKQLSAVREVCDVPLVASGGAGAAEHFVNVFEKAGVDAALAASVFHSGAIAIPDLKTTLPPPASRCVYETARSRSTASTSRKAMAWSRPSCRTPETAPCSCWAT